MVVYLIRHTSVDVPQGVCYGQTDVPLNPTFEEEAAQTSARLKGLQFDKVYMSPLTAVYVWPPSAVTRMANEMTVSRKSTLVTGKCNALMK